MQILMGNVVLFKKLDLMDTLWKYNVLLCHYSVYCNASNRLVLVEISSELVELVCYVEFAGAFDRVVKRKKPLFLKVCFL